MFKQLKFIEFAREYERFRKPMLKNFRANNIITSRTRKNRNSNCHEARKRVEG
jgi:hypothetical protein